MKFFCLMILLACGIYAGDWVEPYIHGELSLQNSEMDKALSLYNKSIALDPDQAFPYIGLAQVYLHKNEYDLAKESLEKAKNAKYGFDHEVVQKYRLYMMVVAASANERELYKRFHDEYYANSYDIPRSYTENGYIYIFNAPKMDCFRKMMETTMKACENIEEINWYGDIGIAKLKN